MENKLTQLQAYKVMYIFLDIYYVKTLSDDLGNLLSGMAILRSDEEPADPAFWEEWIEAIGNNNNELTLTPLQALQAAITFIEKYCAIGAGVDVWNMIGILQNALAGTKLNSPLWKEWLACTNKILQDNEKKYGYFQLLNN